MNGIKYHIRCLSAIQIILLENFASFRFFLAIRYYLEQEQLKFNPAVGFDTFQDKKMIYDGREEETVLQSIVGSTKLILEGDLSEDDEAPNVLEMGSTYRFQV
jgi:hypothetical protein